MNFRFTAVTLVSITVICVSAPDAGAQTVKPYHAQQIEVYKGRDLEQEQRDARRNQQQNNSRNATPVSRDTTFFQRTFGLAIPGVAYTVDNHAANTRTLVTSTGAVTKSAVRINPNHTYDWNSQWDGRLIHGKWIEHKDGIVLLKAQEGKNWLMQRMARPSGKAVVTLWDQNSIWYNGTPLN